MWSWTGRRQVHGMDRIADIWGTRIRSGGVRGGRRGWTPHWPTGSAAPTSTVGCLPPASCAATDADVRSPSRKATWSASAGGGRSGEPGAARTQGSVRELPGRGQRCPPDPAADPSRRTPGAGELGRGHGHARRPQSPAAGDGWAAVPRLLHQRAAVPPRVLGAGGHRQGRYRHAAGRQHPAVHGHCRGRAQGNVRL
jgi:hypothetical protein